MYLTDAQIRERLTELAIRVEDEKISFDVMPITRTSILSHTKICHCCMLAFSSLLSIREYWS